MRSDDPSKYSSGSFSGYGQHPAEEPKQPPPLEITTSEFIRSPSCTEPGPSVPGQLTPSKPAVHAPIRASSSFTSWAAASSVPGQLRPSEPEEVPSGQQPMSLAVLPSEHTPLPCPAAMLTEAPSEDKEFSELYFLADQLRTAIRYDFHTTPDLHVSYQMLAAIRCSQPCSYCVHTVG